MKKRWGILTLSLLLTAGLMTACGQNNNNDNNSAAEASGNTAANTSSAPAESSANKKLIVGLSADYPPFEFHAKSADGKDEIKGVDVNIASEIAKDMGAEIEVKDLQFSSLLNELKSDRVDLIISGLSPTPERAKEIDFSNVYYKAVQNIMVAENDKDKYATMESLEGKKVGVQTGSIQEEIGKGIKGAKLTSLAKTSDIIMQLKSGRIDAAIIEAPVAENYVANVDGLAITDAKPQVDEDGYVVGIKKGNTELLNQVNATLDRLAEENLVEQYVQQANELADQQE